LSSSHPWRHFGPYRGTSRTPTTAYYQPTNSLHRSQCPHSSSLILLHCSEVGILPDDVTWPSQLQ
jgi:hypothetical protein